MSAEVASSSSTVIQTLVEDADGEGGIVLPVSVACASVPAVAVVASWLCTSSPLDPKPSDIVPKVDVSQTPGTTGMRGAKVVRTALADPWVTKVLQRVFPLEQQQIRFKRREAYEYAANDDEVTLDVTTGVRGLQLLYHVTQLAGFLGMSKLMELCSSYILHALQECIRDERAFGVSERLGRSEEARGTHVAVAIVRRSLALPPADWDPAVPHDNIVGPVAAIDDDGDRTQENMMGWLREACTGMTL